MILPAILLAGTPVLAAESIEMNVVVVIHAGEGDCTFENVTDARDAAFVACRDGLSEITAELESLGIAAEFQIQPGFLSLLASDRSPRRFDLESDLIDRGHGLGVHIHNQCAQPIDFTGDCSGFGFWGNTSGAQTPTLSVFDLRARSIDLAANAEGIEPSSFNIWGGTYRLADDVDSGSTDAIDTLSALGFQRAVGAENVTYTFAKDETSTCFDGVRTDSVDTFRSMPHPILIPGGDPFSRVVLYNSATTKWGDLLYSETTASQGFEDAIECLHDRVVNAETTGWNGEIFTYAGITHLHNLLEDADSDGNYDGIEDLESFMTMAEAAAVDASDTDVEISIAYRDIATLEGLRWRSVIVGADYTY